jgi:hypothetical protein
MLPLYELSNLAANMLSFCRRNQKEKRRGEMYPNPASDKKVVVSSFVAKETHLVISPRACPEPEPRAQKLKNCSTNKRAV